MNPKMISIPTVDAAFLHLETRDTPMHVAGLQIFSLPRNAGPDFLRQLVADLKRPRALAAPWNLKLKRSPLSGVVPMWQTDPDVNLDDHVRHVALPQPGRERELGALVSRLNSQCLDRRRPLWDCHLIEGLEGNRFALFTRIHHALADGVTAMRLCNQPLAKQPAARISPPWALQARVPGAMPAVPAKSLRARASTTVDAARGLARLALRSGADARDLVAPFAAPDSLINARVGPHRRLTTQQFPIARLKRVARAAEGTLNDVVLALCGAALRRFLDDADALPEKSLVAAIPMSLRAPGDDTAGNAVSMMLARIGSDLADPRVRLAAIRESTQRAKEHLRAMTPDAQALYGSLLATPFLLQTLSGLTGRTRPYFNVCISNVPGPGEPLYLRGARLEAIYPVSIAAHGQALNITCTSYAGTLNFGIVGCRDALPHLQRLAVYLEDAMTELERAFGIIRLQESCDAKVA